MEKSDLAAGDRVVISAVFFDKHGPMIGRTGTVKRVYKTLDQALLELDNGDRWYATPCNLSPEGAKGASHILAA